MKRILVIITNPRQASYRLRVEVLRGPLARMGFDLEARVRPRTWGGWRALALSASSFHAVILQRKLLDPWQGRLLRSHSRRLLYDVDDAVMCHPRPTGWWSRWRTSRRFLATARIIDMAVAGNGYLARIFQDQGCEATVLPTHIDAGRYRVKQHGPTDSPCLVWIGSRSTIPYLRLFLPALEEANRRIAGLRLLTIADAALPVVPSLRLEHISWSLAGESEALCRGDMGIAPTPEDPWTLGKCGFKVLQYMAAGLPVIASPVGSNSELVRAGETGLLPPRAEDWPAAVEELARSPEARSRMGRAGRSRVETEFPLEKAAEAWAGLLRD